KERGVKEMKASLIIRRDGAENPVEISPNHPGKFEGYAISLVEVRSDRYLNLYLGLQLTRKPGEPLFWTGVLGFLGFILVHLVQKWGRMGSP
ncbi:MAG: hypothetical protein D6713_09380, partial [Deltaproteobacteria bacterium]